MELLAKGLYVIGAIPTIGGIAVLVALAPRPRTIEQHLQGLSRYLILGGAIFGTVRILSTTTPSWNAVAFMVGVGLSVAIYARRNHKQAIAQEMDERRAQKAAT
jgi:hypothetical protein